MIRQSKRPPKLTLQQLNERLEALERERLALAVSPRWWHDHAGRFQDDPAFDEIVRLGRQARNGNQRKQVGKRRAGSRH